MKKRLLLVLAVVSVLVLGLAIQPTSAQDTVELRMLWYNDGNEGDVMRDLLDRFEAENPNIKVVLDTVAFADLHNILQAQVEAGGSEAPDMARITQTPRFRDFYLDLTPYVADPAYWEASFSPFVLGSFRKGADDTGLYGYPTQFTVSMPFVNLTLFEQAGIELPGEGATWAEWQEAAVAVAEATETPYAIAIDRSGHRLFGPMMSLGAQFFNEDGSITVDNEGFRMGAQMLLDWHNQEITPREVWVAAGDQYAPARPFFEQGQLVMYMSGSWQIAGLNSTIGDLFDWTAVPNPTGDGGSTGMPGGAVVAAMATTEYPEEVGMVMDYLVSPEVMKEFTERTLFLPAHLALIESGVDYQTDDEALLATLNVALGEVAKLSEQAYQLQYSPLIDAFNINTRDRLSQVIVGEITLDEAIALIQEEVDKAFAATQN